MILTNGTWFTDTTQKIGNFKMTTKRKSKLVAETAEDVSKKLQDLQATYDVAIKEEEGNKDSKFLDERLSIKTKGAFCERGSALNSILSKNPETLICIDAVLQLVKNNIPIEETIRLEGVEPNQDRLDYFLDNLRGIAPSVS